MQALILQQTSPHIDLFSPTMTCPLTTPEFSPWLISFPKDGDGLCEPLVGRKLLSFVMHHVEIHGSLAQLGILSMPRIKGVGKPEFCLPLLNSKTSFQQ